MKIEHIALYVNDLEAAKAFFGSIKCQRWEKEILS